MKLFFYILLPFVVLMIDMDNKVDKRTVIRMRFYSQPITDGEIDQIREVITMKRLISKVKNQKKKGLQAFQYPTGVIWAINKENADKKYKKLVKS